MITERQEKILNALIKEYIRTPEPVSSEVLKKRGGLNVSPATIRNDLQILTKQGFIVQPHTSAGRVPTKKAYKYFTGKAESQSADNFSDFIFSEAINVRKQIENELKLAEELTKSLFEVSMTLSYTKIQNKDNLLEILEILGSSKTNYDENVNLISKIIKQLENF